MPFFALRIKNQNRWCPVHVKTVKPRGVFFDMSLDGYKIFLYERRDALIGVRLGFQPSTSASLRGCTKIKQDGPACLACVCQREIDVFVPFNQHVLDPPIRLGSSTDAE